MRLNSDRARTLLVLALGYRRMWRQKPDPELKAIGLIPRPW